MKSYQTIHLQQSQTDSNSALSKTTIQAASIYETSILVSDIAFKEKLILWLTLSTHTLASSGHHIRISVSPLIQYWCPGIWKKKPQKPCQNKVGWKKSHMYTLRYACCIITATFVLFSHLWFFSLSSNVFWLSSFPPQDLMSFLELSASSTKNCFPLIWWKQRIRRSSDMKTILRALAY